MPSITVETLITRAKALADMHDNYITPTEWITWANTENLNLNIYLARCGWVINTRTLSGLITSSGWTTTDSGPSSSVASDAQTNAVSGFYKLGSTAGTLQMMAVVCVHEVASDGTVRQLTHDNHIDFLSQLPSSTRTTNHARKFRVVREGSQLYINFFPAPVAGETYLVTYVPAPSTLALTSDTVDYPLGWEERIILGMAHKALIKEESDPSKIETLIREQESKIEEICWSRVLGENPSVRNVDNRIYGWSDRIAFPPWQEWAWV